MKRKFQKALAILLVLCFAASLAPMALAEDTTSGTCGNEGDNVTWTLEDGVLTISGTGEMEDYFVSSPWYSAKEDIVTVIINDGVTSISDWVFYNCTNITSITIPNSVASIGDWAFDDCASLKGITIPSSVTSIGESVFYGCSSLAEIEVSEESIAYSAADGVLFDKNITELVCYPAAKADASYIIPSGVSSIGNKSFWGCSNLISITMPNSITNIGSGAFEDCTNLSSITIPNNVTNIESSAFRGCSSLTSITIPNGVTNIGDSVFYGCNSLTRITLPSNLTSIKRYLFSGCSSLSSITIPTSVTSIEMNAFAKCTGLTSINIPSNVTSIKLSAFEECTGLTEIIIPDSVTYIGSLAFYGCTNLSTITIPDSVTRIMDEAFSGTAYYNNSENWENDTLYINNWLVANNSKTQSEYTIKDGTVGIANNAFSDCSSLTSITIPSSVTSIGDGSFTRCDNLTSITLPNGITSIKSWTFNKCTNLPDIAIPDSVTSVETGAFYGCANFTDIIIPDNVISIGNYAFCECDSLTSITIPSSIAFIGWAAFSECTKLADVYYDGSEDDWNVIEIEADNECLTYATIHYNDGSTSNDASVPTVTSSASSTSTKITVTFSVEDNGSDVTDYTITLYSSEGEELDSQTALEAGSVTFADLTPQTAYTIEVSATNAVGTTTETITATTSNSILTTSATADAYTYSKCKLYFNAALELSNSVAALLVTNIVKNNTALTITCTLTSDLIAKLIESDIDYELVDAYGMDCESSLSVSGDTATATFVLSSPFGELDESNTEEAQALISDILAGEYSCELTASASTTAANFAEVQDSVDEITYVAGLQIASYTATDSGTVVVTTHTEHVDGGGGNPSHSSTTTTTTTDGGGGGSSDDDTSTSSTATATAEETPFVNPFNDISEKQYYYAPVVWAAENGIVFGTSDTEFSPEAACTRAQAVTFLWRAAGSPEVSGENPFTDVSEDNYYYTAVLWALQNGITTGTSDDAFSPDATCTRAEIVTFLYRASGETSEAAETFTDVTADAWYAEAVAWAASEGITTGTSETTFTPDASCTRGQIVTFLYRDMA